MPFVALLLLGYGCEFDTRPILLDPQAASPATAAGSTGPAPVTPPDTGFGNPPMQAVPAPRAGTGAAGSAVAGGAGGGASAPPPVIDDGTPPPVAPLDAGIAPADAEVTPPVDMPARADAASQTDAAGGDPDLPAPGSVFSACGATTDCDQGLVCTNSLAWMSDTAERGYCVAYCAVDASCPQQPSSGLVAASCQFGGMCLLGSCERSQCPRGMTCRIFEMTVGAGQFPIEYYACQP